MKQEHEIVYHDGLEASIIQQPGSILNDGLYLQPYPTITIKSADGKILVCESAYNMAEARRWVKEQFQFPSSILILKYHNALFSS